MRKKSSNPCRKPGAYVWPMIARGRQTDMDSHPAQFRSTATRPRPVDRRGGYVNNNFACYVNNTRCRKLGKTISHVRLPAGHVPTRVSENSMSLLLPTRFREFVRLDEPLSPLTWFRLGGVAKYLAEPRCLDDLRDLVLQCRSD